MAGPKAVIFDHTTVLGQARSVTAGLRDAQGRLKALGARTVVFSTHAQPDLAARFAQCGYPPLDLFLTRQDVAANKGSPRWVAEASARLGIPAHRFFYLGDDKRDWETAINSGVLYLHAGWTGPRPADVTAYAAADPANFYRFLSHFFLPPARWQYRLDDEDRGLHVRSLLNATVSLAADSPHGAFSLQDVFTYENARTVGGTSARDLLMMHAIANLCDEGLICTGCRFAVYPGSTPGATNPTFTEFLGPASCFFHAWLFADILQRGAQATDTSMVRAGRAQGQVNYCNQTNTVHVHPRHRSSAHVRRKRVIVFDDFTTSGMSLEWARALLTAAGAERVILVTFGKYSRRDPAVHTCYGYPPAKPVQPFQLNSYSENEFTATDLMMPSQDANRDVTREMFQRWRAGEAYPVTTL